MLKNLKKKIINRIKTVKTLKILKLYILSFIIALISITSIEDARLSIFSVYDENQNDLYNDYQLEKDYLNMSPLGKEKLNTPKENRPENAIDIAERFYEYKAGGSILPNRGSGLIKNAASRSVEEINSIINQEPNLKVELNSKNPQVLIVHTHTTESFEKFDLGYYNPEVPTRSNDENLNTLAIGQAMKAELDRAGINTIQDRVIHDRSYSEAYDSSRASVQDYLQKYPSIKIVLDIHRDAITDENGIRYKPTAIIDDKKAAQIMIVSGTTGKGVNLPNYPENLKLASRLQDKIEEKYKGLTRPILFDFRHYNQDLSTGSLLIEVGSQASTITEVVYSGKLIGISLAEYLKSKGT